MGNETILYYVTQETILGEGGVLSETLGTGNGRKKIWQKPQLPFFEIEQDNLTIYAVVVPKKCKTWKKDKLLRLMVSAQERMIQSEQEMQWETKYIVLQPELAMILQQEREELSEPFLFLANQMLHQVWQKQKKTFDSIVLLLGNEVFPEIQMRYFAQMLQPFFSQINYLQILYTAEEEEQGRWQEAIEEYTDTFYYEYGLMAQITEGKEIHSRHRYHENGRRNTGRNKSGTLFLDYGYTEELPFRMMQAGDTYLDVGACEKKETLLKRKCTEVFYLSPLKYLDTTVKSGYDKLVHLCK